MLNILKKGEKMKKLLFIMLACKVFASCTCECVDGEVRAMCSSSLDTPPICPPRICPLDTPSIKPIKTPSLPPIGTKHCKQARVYNQQNMEYEWQEICE